MSASELQGSAKAGKARSWASEHWALLVLFAYTAIAITGYATFGVHGRAENLNRFAGNSDWAIQIYQIAFIFFSRAQIVVSATALFVALFRNAGLRWLPAFAAVYVISFLAEHIGTGYGFPFSGYGYTAMLGPRVGERVPAVIPMSWFTMAAPSWLIAREVFPRGSQWLSRIVLGAVMLVIWDLALDPAMSYLTTYWIWESPGSFYGMPWVNIAGWMFTGLFIFSALEWLQARTDWAGSLSASWATAYYAAVILMPLGMVTAGGLWGSTAATLGSLAAVFMLYRLQRGSDPSVAATASTSSMAPQEASS